MPFTTRASQPQLRAAQPLHSAIFRPFSTPSSGVNPIQSTNSSPSSSPTTQTLPTNNHSFPSTKPSTQVPIQQHRNSLIQRRHPPSIVTTSHRTNNAPNSANSSLSHTATSTKRTNLPSPNPQRSSSRIRRAHERLRAMTDDMFENDPMSLPVVFRADLGDDDSFSPDIVSGYLFNGPRARESNATAVPETSSSFQIDHVQEIAIEATAVRQLEFGTDLGEDDEYDGGELACDTSAPEFRLEFSSDVLQHSQKPDEPDHRMDAIYDDLDDIGGWIADSTPAGTDLTKQLDRALSTAPDRGIDRTTAMANAALSSQQRVEDRRREKQARDKLDRATVEQVLDPKTRMILFKLLSRNRLRTLEGCVSTGKEANVYFATAASDPSASTDISGSLPPMPGLLPHEFSPDAPVAVKVFKTSILQFKDRERYVAGEFRFRRTGYQRGSNRKMVQQWAEKEFRNQVRLQEAGIPAPIPLLLKPPVLIMSFFGKDGWPAPRLKDASLSPTRLRKVYFRVCMIMRRMFRVAHLVHGDLSEYNMLYWKGEVIVIDVSQSVEDDHPMALDFLRRDCANVNEFFRRNGLNSVLSVRELFDFVTGEHIGELREEEENALGYLIQSAGNRDSQSMLLFRRDDEVFMKSYIPRTLQEVELREEQFRGKEYEHVESRLFSKLTGLTLTQRRDHSSGKSVSKSLVRKNRSKQTETEGAANGTTFSWHSHEDEAPQITAASLDTPCDEPATLLIPSNSDKSGMHISSPCTSNGSSRPNGDDCEGKTVMRYNGASEGRNMTTDVSKVYDTSHSTSGVVPEDEDDTFPVDEIDESTSSSDEWVRPLRQEAPDALMGLSKKEWKKRVKAENRERREHKVPKHVKKRKETLAKRRRHQK